MKKYLFAPIVFILTLSAYAYDYRIICDSSTDDSLKIELTQAYPYGQVEGQLKFEDEDGRSMCYPILMKQKNSSMFYRIHYIGAQFSQLQITHWPDQNIVLNKVYPAILQFSEYQQGKPQTKIRCRYLL